jgi:precorrin-2/cobalt-factor-2 C20-methyltransferase
MTGTLRVAGVGPGDPELMTVKAVKAIQQSDILCVPKGREAGSSLALSIAAQAVNLDGKEIIEAYFPMKKTKQLGTKSGEVKKASGLSNFRASSLVDDEELDQKWNETVQAILNKLEKGSDVVFLTLGDPMIYSTFFYLYDRLKEALPDLNIEIIPGVSSINASAARASVSLGLANEKIAVLPANYMEDLKDTLKLFDTVVLMKVNKVWNEIIQLLTSLNMIEHAVFVSRATMEDEQIFHNIREVQQDEITYFSMVIVRK